MGKKARIWIIPILGLFLSTTALGASDTNLIRGAGSANSGIRFTETGLGHRLRPPQFLEPGLEIEVTGEQPAGGTLVIDNRRVRSEDGKFSAWVVVYSAESKHDAVYIDDRGDLVREELTIHVPDWENKLLRPQWRYSFGLGPTMGTYKELNLQDFSYMNVTLRGDFSYGRVWRHWTLGLSTYFTGFTFSKSIPVDTRFLGVNFRASRNIKCFAGGKWCVDGAVGWYYTTMFTAGDAFGFTHMNGPQIYPIIRRNFNATTMGLFYFKYSPVSDRFRFTDLSNREIAFGPRYQFMYNEKWLLSVGLDYSNIQMTLITRSGTAVPVSNTTISASISVIK